MLYISLDMLKLCDMTVNWTSGGQEGTEKKDEENKTDQKGYLQYLTVGYFF